MKKLITLTLLIAFAAVLLTPAISSAEKSTAFYRILLQKDQATIEDGIRATARFIGFEGSPELLAHPIEKYRVKY